MLLLWRGIPLLLPHPTEAFVDDVPAASVRSIALNASGERSQPSALPDQRRAEPASVVKAWVPVHGALHSKNVTPRCAGLRLFASLVNAEDSQRSLAAVRVGRTTQLVRVGGRIGELELIALHPERAYLRSDTGICMLPVFLPASERPHRPTHRASPPTLFASSAKYGPPFSEEELSKGVRSLPGGRFAISRLLLARVAAKPGALIARTFFRIHDERGRRGVELVRLRRGSPFLRLGLQKGDLLRVLNGIDLADSAALVRALGTLRAADTMTLSVLRGGRLVSIHYILE